MLGIVITRTLKVDFFAKSWCRLSNRYDQMVKMCCRARMMYRFKEVKLNAVLEIKAGLSIPFPVGNYMFKVIKITLEQRSKTLL